MGWLSTLLKTGATIGAGVVNPFLGAAVGGAISANDEANRASEVRKQNRAKAEANKYSALTNRWQDMEGVNENMLKAATGGIAGGYMQGKSSQKFMADNPNMFNFGDAQGAIPQGATNMANNIGGEGAKFSLIAPNRDMANNFSLSNPQQGGMGQNMQLANTGNMMNLQNPRPSWMNLQGMAY